MSTIRITKKLDAIAGLKIPLAFGAYPDFFASIPILFTFGMEYEMVNNLNFNLLVELGPDVTAGSWGSYTRFAPKFLFGITYAW